MKSARFRTLFALAVLLAPGVVAWAEEDRLTVRLGERLSRIPEGAEGAYRVEVDASGLASASGFTAELPGGSVFEARQVGLERRPQGDFAWSGESDRGEAVVLTVQGGRVVGTIFGSEAGFQIYPDGASPDAPSHVLLEVDADSLPGCGGAPHPKAEESGVLARAALVAESSRTPRIDVLVLYDASTTQAVGSKRNMEAIVQHFVDITNIAFHNSEVESRVRLVHAAETVLPSTLIGNNSGILQWLRESAEIADLRSQHGADLVGFVYERQSGFCGSASMIYRPGGPTANRAFFELRRICAATTFAHEVGHLMGGDHNPENAVIESGILYGRGHYYDGDFRTIMSYANPCSGPCPTQPFFSNPGVRYDGRTTGRRNERDNSRVFNDFADDVANFVPAVNDSAVCSLAPGHPDYCLECGPCLAGEGNCETNTECDSGLSCASDVGAEFGLGVKVNVCVAKSACTLDPGDPEYCSVCGPCGFGTGDCDSDRECQAGLLCLDDVGEIFGLAPSADVCAFREGEFCPLPPGHPDFCTACGPCESGEGNCKSSSECITFATCYEDIGVDFGFSKSTNICLRSTPSECLFQPGAPEFCKVCGTCDLGEGDCDTDRECRGGLTCVDGAGPQFGFGDEIDLCLESGDTTVGALATPKKLKAKVLSATRVRLRWKDKSKDEDGFHVERSVEGAAFERVESVSANKKKLILEELIPGTTYTFRVQAFGAAGLSAYSNEKTVTTPN